MTPDKFKFELNRLKSNTTKTPQRTPSTAGRSSLRSAPISESDDTNGSDEEPKSTHSANPTQPPKRLAVRRSTPTSVGRTPRFRESGRKRLRKVMENEEDNDKENDSEWSANNRQSTLLARHF